MNPNDILDFWFKELSPADWWKKSDQLDSTITDRFQNIHTQAKMGELFSWRSTPEGRLAEVIILDQFSRNIYRGQPKTFANDSLALVLSQEAIKAKADQDFSNHMKSFLYLPHMHSESALIHEEAVRLYQQVGLEFYLEFEMKHKKIIDQFNRYPHRNEILNRESTDDELEFLKEEGSSF